MIVGMYRNNKILDNSLSRLKMDYEIREYSSILKTPPLHKEHLIDNQTNYIHNGNNCIAGNNNEQIF